jgi:predicted Zn-dependent protease with MMP-like domain
VLCGAAPVAYGAVVHVSRSRFEALVERALDEVPDEFVAAMDNVAIVVEDRPSAEQRAELGPDVLGLYEGVALTERGFNDAFALPDRIVLFREPLCAIADHEDDLVEEIVVTVIHEIAHHFGIDDDRLEELGWD